MIEKAVKKIAEQTDLLKVSHAAYALCPTDPTVWGFECTHCKVFP
jgi:hypothetical protein